MLKLEKIVKNKNDKTIARVCMLTFSAAAVLLFSALSCEAATSRELCISCSTATVFLSNPQITEKFAADI